MERVKAGIGYSRRRDGGEAGREAARQACAQVGKPALAFLFTTEEYDQAAVLSQVLEDTRGARLVGACGAGIVTPEGVLREGVGVLALAGEVEAATALVSFAPEEPEATGRRLGEALLSASSAPEGTVIVFPDGLAGNIAGMLRGLYDVAGPDFKCVGGGTGDNLRFMATCQMTEAGVASNAVAAALIAGCSFGLGVGHGWKPVGSPLIITRARDRVIYELDERPATAVYAQRVGDLDVERFPEYGMRHPLGIADASGRFIIRDPLLARPDGSIQLMTEVPSRAVAYLMQYEREELLGVTQEVAAAAKGQVRKPRFALAFHCVSRSLLLGYGVGERIIREALGESVPFLGLLTFGEVAPYDDAPLFHNKTLVVAVGGE
ncbi:MAG: FIST signal transduction protein [Desulfotomaculales bacterium]